MQIFGVFFVRFNKIDYDHEHLISAKIMCNIYSFSTRSEVDR